MDFTFIKETGLQKVFQDKNIKNLVDYVFGVETGLQKVFQNKNIKNLVDYVFGVETGLDTNARKNRSGDLMANRVASVFDNNGVIFKRQ
ncbi:type II restriction endonuclease [Prevotella buccae]|uniref:type II restriction endonuclease n=1 Tax=Segatella buccae TaxID=28126 RepID=UPI001C5E1A90|nr:type II restriction endonuclease [Segatella buccae]